MKLKTLKDLEKETELRMSNGNVVRRNFDIIKAEAVKWVKEKFNLKHTIGCGFHADKGWLEFTQFHNITEEDLK